MSPGPTFDRVYFALKEQLTSGRHPPGAHLEPSVLGDELCSSITPIRDALHRLVGERLVEAPRNDGFRAPMITELGLRQLYGWQADLLRLALARHRSSLLERVDRSEGLPEAGFSSAADLLLDFARSSDNPELLAALANACARLAPVRILEARFLPGLAGEVEPLQSLWKAGDTGRLRSVLTAYQRRRDRAVPQLVAELQRSI